MKMRCFVPALLLMMPGICNGQLQVGPSVGVSRSTIVGGELAEFDSRTAPHFGFVAVWHPQASQFGILTGLSYAAKGAPGSEAGRQFDLKLSYAELPMMLRWSPIKQVSAILPIVEGGGVVGFNTGCGFEIEEGNFDCNEEDFNGGLAIRSVDVGISAGVSVDIKLGRTGVLAPSVRYTRGLQTIWAERDGELKNSTIKAVVAYRIRM